MTNIILFRPQRMVQNFPLLLNKFGHPQRQLSFLLFQGDEGRSTFAMSKLQWGAFRDANEKQDK